MKSLLIATLLLLGSHAFAASSELNVPVRLKADPSVSLRLLVDAYESDDDTILISNPRMKGALLSFSVPIERLESTGDALCAAVDHTHPFSFLNEIGVANQSVISMLNDKQIANLELVNDTLLVEMRPVTSGRWFYTYK